MASTTIQIRIDSKTKKEAKKLFESFGLDISSATKMFIKQSLNTKSIPFEVRTENGFTRAQEEEILKEVEWAKKHGKRFQSVEAMMKSLDL